MLSILLIAAGAILETLFIMQSYRRRDVASIILKTTASLLFVLLGFILFDAPNAATALTRIAGLVSAPQAASTASLYALRSYAVVLLVAIFAATPLPKRLFSWLQTRLPRLCGVLEPVALLVLLAVGTAYLIDGSFNPFLYFRF